MTITVTQLQAPVLLTGTLTSYITAPAKTNYRVSRACFCNMGAATTVTVAMGLTLMNAVPVPAGWTYVSPELAGLVIPQGKIVQASSPGTVIFYASGTAHT
jgi:hypothetical protein